ncbi:uncharacterized protein LOC108665250 isoform X2 [Hyalella azteca]|uniref:Uncharacterized protein LOC108665250 isoform X2 n=1 Tax=Hyalella azteca TaxID=294128 RepID=A0A8B7N1P5_HYAAZ|nr:uncharacterized protein LOC108665250 isoform X2 [Hyalella azteca]
MDLIVRILRLFIISIICFDTQRVVCFLNTINPRGNGLPAIGIKDGEYADTVGKVLSNNPNLSLSSWLAELFHIKNFTLKMLANEPYTSALPAFHVDSIKEKNLNEFSTISSDKPTKSTRNFLSEIEKFRKPLKLNPASSLDPIYYGVKNKLRHSSQRALIADPHQNDVVHSNELHDDVVTPQQSTSLNHAVLPIKATKLSSKVTKSHEIDDADYKSNADGSKSDSTSYSESFVNGKDEEDNEVFTEHGDYSATLLPPGSVVTASSDATSTGEETEYYRCSRYDTDRAGCAPQIVLKSADAPVSDEPIRSTPRHFRELIRKTSFSRRGKSDFRHSSVFEIPRQIRHKRSLIQIKTSSIPHPSIKTLTEGESSSSVDRAGHGEGSVLLPSFDRAGHDEGSVLLPSFDRAGHDEGSVLLPSVDGAIHSAGPFHREVKQQPTSADLCRSLPVDSLKAGVMSKLRSQFQSRVSKENCTLWNHGSVMNNFMVLHENNTALSESVMLTVQQPGVYLLFCSDIASNVNCTRRLQVGYSPQDVENFDCISHNYDDLECWFDVMPNPVPVLNISICIVDDGECDILSPSRIKNGRRQVWQFDTFHNFSRNLTFNISLGNDLGNATFQHTINYFTKVRLEAARSIKYRQLESPLEFALEWLSPSNYHTLPSVRARVNVSSVFYNHTIMAYDSHLKLHLPYHNLDYTVTIELQPDEAEAKYWSNPASTSMTTPTASPSAPPAAAPGMFQTWSTSKTSSSVNVSWVSVAPALHAGPGFGYIVEVYGCSTAFSECTECVSSSFTDDSFDVITNLRSDRPHRIDVYSANLCQNLTRPRTQCGLSTHCRSAAPAQYHIPVAGAAAALAPAFPTSLFLHSPAAASLQWFTRDGRASNFTLYYCRDAEPQCKSGLGFLWVGEISAVDISLHPAPSSPGALSLRNFTGYRTADESSTGLRFAVSAERTTDGVVESSGMVWSECRAEYDDEPLAPPQLLLNNKTWHSALVLRRPECLPRLVAATKFVLCRPDMCNESVVAVWQKEIFLDNLQSDTRYNATLRVLYTDGNVTVTDEPLVFRTRPKDLLWWHVVLLASGALLFTTLLVSVFLYSKRCVHKSIKDATDPLSVPDFSGPSTIVRGRKSVPPNISISHQRLETAPVTAAAKEPPSETRKIISLLFSPPEDSVLVGGRTVCASGTNEQTHDVGQNPSEVNSDETSVLMFPSTSNEVRNSSYSQIEFDESEDEEEFNPAQNPTTASGYPGYVMLRTSEPLPTDQNVSEITFNEAHPYVALGTLSTETTRNEPMRDETMDHNTAMRDQNGVIERIHASGVSPYVLVSPTSAHIGEDNITKDLDRKVVSPSHGYIMADSVQKLISSPLSRNITVNISEIQEVNQGTKDTANDALSQSLSCGYVSPHPVIEPVKASVSLMLDFSDDATLSDEDDPNMAIPPVMATVSHTLDLPSNHAIPATNGIGYAADSTLPLPDTRSHVQDETNPYMKIKPLTNADSYMLDLTSSATSAAITEIEGRMDAKNDMTLQLDSRGYVQAEKFINMKKLLIENGKSDIMYLPEIATIGEMKSIDKIENFNKPNLVNNGYVLPENVKFLKTTYDEGGGRNELNFPKNAAVTHEQSQGYLKHSDEENIPRYTAPPLALNGSYLTSTVCTWEKNSSFITYDDVREFIKKDSAEVF